MKHKTSTTLLIIAVISVLAYVLLKPSNDDGENNITGMAWQIDTHADGTSSVFGINLEVSTVAEVIGMLDLDHELAIISDQQDHSGLELYYSHFATGPLKAKLIISVNAQQDELFEMQARASKSNYMASGARKFLLNSEDLATIQNWPVEALEFIPSANLDDNVIRSLFGEPSTVTEIDKSTRIYLYPEKGLAITHNDDGKEVLQYVSPKNFKRLSDGT